MVQVSGWDAFTPPASAAYPRVYRYSARARFVRYVGAVLMTAGAGWLVFESLVDASRVSAIELLRLGGAGLVVLAGFIASSCAVSRITLRAGSIEVRGLFRTRELRRDAIIGRRLVQPAKAKAFQVLLPRTGRPLSIDSAYPRDALLDNWINTLPDLDKQERDASQAQLAADRSYGVSPAERLALQARSRKVAGVAFIASLVLYV